MWDFNSGWQTARQRTNQRPVSRSRDHSGPMIVTRVSDRILMLPPSIIKLAAPVFHNINVTSLLSSLSEFLPTSAGAGQGVSSRTAAHHQDLVWSPLLAKEAFTRNREKLNCVLVCCELLNDLVNRFRNVILQPSMSTLLVRSSLCSLLISKTAKPILWARSWLPVIVLRVFLSQIRLTMPGFTNIYSPQNPLGQIGNFQLCPDWVLHLFWHGSAICLMTMLACLMTILAAALWHVTISWGDCFYQERARG